MAKIIHKKSSVAGRIPTTGDLDYGELALNYADGILYYKTSTNTIGTISAGGGGSATLTWLVKSANYTAAVGDNILTRTPNGSFTVTLPSAPSAGDAVTIADGSNWGSTAITVGRNGLTIESTAEDFTLDIPGITVTFVYDGTTWQLFTTAGLREVPVQSGNGGKFLTTDGTNLSWSNLIVRQELTASSATTTLNLGAYDDFVVTMAANTTFSLTNISQKLGRSGSIVIKQNGVGGYTFTKAAEMKTPLGGAGIAQTTAANSVSLISYYVVDASTVLINYIGNFA